jgi:hypothetical protein
MSGTFSLAAAAQAGAEYAVTATRKALTTPSGSLQQVLDGWVAYARENSWVVFAGCIVGFLVLRWVFSIPRVR